MEVVSRLELDLPINLWYLDTLIFVLTTFPQILQNAPSSWISKYLEISFSVDAKIFLTFDFGILPKEKGR